LSLSGDDQGLSLPGQPVFVIFIQNAIVFSSGFILLWNAQFSQPKQFLIDKIKCRQGVICWGGMRGISLFLVNVSLPLLN